MLFDTGFEGPFKTVLPTYISIVGVVTIGICEAPHGVLILTIVQ